MLLVVNEGGKSLVSMFVCIKKERSVPTPKRAFLRGTSRTLSRGIYMDKALC